MTTFSYQNTHLALFCHIDGKDWRPVTATAGGGVIKVAHQPFPVAEDATDTGFAHAVIHKFQTEPDNEIMTSCIILFVSSQPLNGKNQTHAELNDKVRFYMKDRHAYEQVGHWLSEFLKLTFEQAKRITGFKTRAEAHEFEAEFSHFLDIILPGRVDDLLAFRLLCEATKVVAEENTQRTAKGEQTSNTTELASITIYAPSSVAEWLAPFGKSKPEEISQVAGMVGSGVVKEAAEKVLNAVNGSGDLPEAITDFLKLRKPQNP